MKSKTYKLAAAILIVLASTNLPAQKADTPAVQDGAGGAVIVGRGADHKQWQTVREVQIGDRTNRVVQGYNEYATGMHYADPNAPGQWLETQETIAIVNGFGVATQGQHQATFSPSITDSPVTDWLAPDGQRFRTRLMGIVYFDLASGQSVLIAETKASVGQVAGNQVVYPDAFDTISGDARYTYTRSSFEQDILLLKQLPDPSRWQFSPDTVRVQIWTEMLECPAPKERTSVVLASGLSDEHLIFGQCHIPRGKAFAVENDAVAAAGVDVRKAVPVAKELANIENRTWLIETVELKALQPFLDTLPRMAGVPGANKEKSRLAGSGRARPKALVARSREKLVAGFRKPAARPSKGSKIQLAQASTQGRYARAVNLDYAILIGSTNSYTFKADETSYVTGTFTPSTVVFEGGTVIKFAPTNHPNITLTSGTSVSFLSTNYRPVIVTGRDDNTVGTTISGSTGSPAGHVYGDPAFMCYWTFVFPHLRVSYANIGISLDTDGNSGMMVRHCQFVHCNSVLQTEANQDATLENVLIYDCPWVAFDTWPYGEFLIRGTHLTLDTVDTLGGEGSIYLTNSILAAVNDPGSFNIYTNSSATLSSGAGTFQTVGAGSHYLTNSSSCHGAGTTNISPALAGDLARLTTYPPIVFPINAYLGNTNLVLSPQAQRESGQFDIGYAYDPLDYVFGYAYCTNFTSILLTNGVAIGTFAPGYAAAGIMLDQSSSLVSEGSPTNLNRIVRYNTVQEQATTNWQTYVGPSIGTANGATPQARFRFTDWSVLANDADHFYGQQGGDFSLPFIDCQFHGGSFEFRQPSPQVTNCLFERVGVILDGEDYQINPTFRSCTFYGGTNLLNQGGWGTWTFLDNLYDQTLLTNWGGLTITADYNGYATNSWRIVPTGSHDVLLGSTVGYQSSWLGRYYLPTNSALIDKGSLTNAALIGLYHYTTLTNQTKELTNHLDIGFHVVAVNSSGVPIDTDGDGWADFLEDFNGNGSVDSGETDWKNSDTDGDGVNDFLEILQGRNPRVAGSVADTNNVINLRIFTPLR